MALADSAQNSNSLLMGLAAEVDDGKASHLASVTTILLQLPPAIEGVCNELVLQFPVLEHLADRVNTAVAVAEVFDPEGLLCELVVVAFVISVGLVFCLSLSDSSRRRCLNCFRGFTKGSHVASI